MQQRPEAVVCLSTLMRVRSSNRPPNRSDGSTAVAPTPGGEPPPAAGAPQPSRPDTGGGGEPDSPSRRRPISPLDSLGVFQTRSIFHLPRTSSGYFSFDGDSLPSSPLSPRPVTADKGTQTPSPSAQVVQHARQRMEEAHSGAPRAHRLHGPSPRPSSTRPRNAAGDMQAEAIGQELRRIGDDFNRLLLLRGAGGRRPVVIHPNALPHIHQEPAMLLCMAFLLLVIGRIIYLQGSTDSQDHSQV